MVGHTFNSKLELDAEFYSQSTYDPYESQPILDAGARYRIHNPVILLLMAGRGVEPASPNHPYFVGYFGVQFLLPTRAYNADDPAPAKSTPP